MKKMYKKVFIIGMIILPLSNYAQVSTPFNNGFLGNYVGWNSLQTFPLEIRHNATGQPITFFTSNGTPTERMRLTPTGELGLDITAPVSLLHLNSATATAIHGRFTNSSTGASATDGTIFGIETNGEFRLTQFENRNIDFWSLNLALTTPIQRFRIQPNGQVFIGNGTMTENVIDGGPVASFGRTSLLNVRGPINSCGEMSSLATQPVILYGYTSPNDGIAPTNDGFRMHMNLNFEENVNNDALVFEKTDWNNPNPDGYIAFTNTGNDAVERVSAYIGIKPNSIFLRS
jgi:hypothetical protein